MLSRSWAKVPKELLHSDVTRPVSDVLNRIGLIGLSLLKKCHVFSLLSKVWKLNLSIKRRLKIDDAFQIFFCYDAAVPMILPYEKWATSQPEWRCLFKSAGNFTSRYSFRSRSRALAESPTAIR